MNYQIIIKNGRYFDGTGGQSSKQNIGIKDGKIAIVTTSAID
jgi:N-acyl-D-aspartate/D-glutamate deacylase